MTDPAARQAKRPQDPAPPLEPLPDDSHALRLELIATVTAAHAAGLNVNTAGNASVRCRRGRRDGYLLTPSGLACDRLQAEDIVFIDAAGAASGCRAPSSEWPLHTAVYADRSDISAIVHTHSPYATVLACHSLPIPPFHYMVAAAGGTDIRCAGYATFGTEELARQAVAALRDRKACLLANHGVVAAGDGPAAALALATEVENLGRMYVMARALGEPRLLDASEMARVLERFRSYGQPSSK
jgi:L-fuculose-phosphate aldolase